MSNSKVAFVTGVTGQDGAHLANSLLKDGWKVYGGFRRGSSNKTWRLDYLGITKKVDLVECQLTEPQNLIETLQAIRPTEIYNLAGESFVADSFKYPGVSLEVNTHGVLNLLEAARLITPDAKIFSASSSEVFGRGNGEPLNENSDYKPTNPYGISKLAAQHFVRLYRECYEMHACSGILFNHEGPLRGREFVTRKITFNIARLKIKGGDPIELGDFNAARDWGAAEDYVHAMREMLSCDAPEDLVIATGKLTTVREFLRIAAIAVGFEPVFEGEGLLEKCIDSNTGKTIAKVSKKYFRVQDTPPMLGNSTRLQSITSWKGSRKLETLIQEMIDADIERWKKGITNV